MLILLLMVILNKFLYNIKQKYLHDNDLEDYVNNLIIQIKKHNSRLEDVLPFVAGNCFPYVFELFQATFPGKYDKIYMPNFIITMIEKKSEESCLKYLIKQFSSCFNIQEVFNKCIENDYCDILFFLLEKYDNIVIENNYFKKMTTTYPDIIIILFTRFYKKIENLQHEEVLQNFIDNDYFNIVCEYGLEDFLVYILGHDVKITPEIYNDAFKYACQHNQIGIAKILVNKFPDINKKKFITYRSYTLNENTINWLST